MIYYQVKDVVLYDRTNMSLLTVPSVMLELQYKATRGELAVRVQEKFEENDFLVMGCDLPMDINDLVVN